MPLRRPSLPLLLGALAVLVAAAAVLFATGGTGDAARGSVAATTKPQPRRVLRLGADKRFPVAAIPTVDAAKVALRVGGLRAQDAVLGCRTGTVDLGTWCMDAAPRGSATYAEAAGSCVRLGGRLPTAAQLVGAAPKLRLGGRADDRPHKADVAAGRDLREMSSTLVTTSTGSAAAGGFAKPAPTTLQYVTVFDNGDAGGFAGSVAGGTTERFRCAYLERQPTASG
jgi:hypothetical protein